MNLNAFKTTVLFCLLIFLSATSVMAQNVLDDIEEDEKIDTPANPEQMPNLANEKISSIGSSKKIFIITNNNQTFSRGDFITLLVSNKLVCRALVAKTTDEKLSGIKIVKIYNLNLWKQLVAGKDISVLKGDDSYFINKEKAPEKTAKPKAKDTKNESKLQTDEDLFNSTTIGDNEDDLSSEEGKKRLIKPDNLVSLNIGMIQGKDVDGTTKRFVHFSGAWGYQLVDNLWGEGAIGTNTIRDYPFTGLDTQLINITIKGKYTFNAPLYSYFQPYLGYQTILASSPGAGVDPGDNSRTVLQLENEKQLVNSLKKSSIIVGMTILKRIVPGWFIRADFGSDIIDGGLTIEF